MRRPLWLLVLDHVLFWGGLGLMPGLPLMFVAVFWQVVLAGFESPPWLSTFPVATGLLVAWSLMAILASRRMAYSTLRAAGALLTMFFFVTRMYWSQANSQPVMYGWLSAEQGAWFLQVGQIALLAAFLVSAVRWVWSRLARRDNV